jgi:hypothetical protein
MGGHTVERLQQEGLTIGAGAAAGTAAAGKPAAPKPAAAAARTPEVAHAPPQDPSGAVVGRLPAACRGFFAWPVARARSRIASHRYSIAAKGCPRERRCWFTIDRLIGLALTVSHGLQND